MQHMISGLAAALAVLTSPAALHAEEEGNWKIGRIYYRAVCTACHETTELGAISPASKTIAEWEEWSASEKGAMHLTKFVSLEHREAISAENKVAAKFVSFADDKMAADVRAFLVHGAKDSATPATCN